MRKLYRKPYNSNWCCALNIPRNTTFSTTKKKSIVHLCRKHELNDLNRCQTITGSTYNKLSFILWLITLEIAFTEYGTYRHIYSGCFPHCVRKMLLPNQKTQKLKYKNKCKINRPNIPKWNLIRNDEFIFMYFIRKITLAIFDWCWN